MKLYIIPELDLTEQINSKVSMSKQKTTENLEIIQRKKDQLIPHIARCLSGMIQVNNKLLELGKPSLHSNLGRVNDITQFITELINNPDSWKIERDINVCFTKYVRIWSSDNIGGMKPFNNPTYQMTYIRGGRGQYSPDVETTLKVLIETVL